MNALIEKQLADITACIDELRGVLDAQGQQLEESSEAQRQAMQTQWRQSKELATLKREADGFDSLEAENKKYRQDSKALREHLRSILKYTRQLSDEAQK